MSNISPIYLKRITMNGRELIDAFDTCVIYEDLYNHSMSGYIDLKESANIREIMPIIGEELLTLEFASVKGISKEPDDFIKLQLKPYKLENYREGKDHQKLYRLQLQSLTAEVNRTKRVRKFYEGTGTNIAQRIMSNMLKQEFKTLDGAKYSDKVIFPNWNPFKCIKFLASKSISAQYNDPFYLFYEDREGFHLTTTSQLMDKPKVADIEFRIVTGQQDPNVDLYLAQTISFGTLFDIVDQEISGMYGGTLTAYDKVKKEYKVLEKTYQETFGQFKHVGLFPLDSAKFESPKNVMQLMSVNDTLNPGSYTNTSEWAIQRLIRARQVRGKNAQFWMNRGTSLHVGDVIEWNMIKDAQGRIDESLSGKWLITKLKHVVTPITYRCQIEVIKDGQY